jgi:fucose permease
MTPLMGLVADEGGMRIGFVIPLLCFAVIAIYGALWQRLEDRDSGKTVRKKITSGTRMFDKDNVAQ